MNLSKTGKNTGAVAYMKTLKPKKSFGGGGGGGGGDKLMTSTELETQVNNAVSKAKELNKLFGGKAEDLTKELLSIYENATGTAITNKIDKLKTRYSNLANEQRKLLPKETKKTKETFNFNDELKEFEKNQSDKGITKDSEEYLKDYKRFFRKFYRKNE